MSGLWLTFFLTVPRLALVLMYVNTYDLQRAYHAFTFPIAGFLFLPITTMTYAWMLNAGQSAAGINLLTLVITVAMDIGTILSAVFHRRSGLARHYSHIFSMHHICDLLESATRFR